MSRSTTIYWNAYIREAIVEQFSQRMQQKIGGKNTIVEIDESIFTKRKNNTGRVLPQQWIFRGLCRETGGCFLVQVPDRSAKTLMEKIEKHVKDGTTIFSDSWCAYKSVELEKAGFQHFKVSHKYNFVNPDTGTQTQNIERIWGSAKWRNIKHRGTARHHLESYLAEFIWRKHVEAHIFDGLLQTISAFWPPESKMQK